MKRIVVCCDGTWNNDDQQTNDTNVSLLARAVHGSQQTGGVLQIVLYVRGVGTTGLAIETLIAGAVGLGVDDNIRSAYQFIAQNYVPGDEIYLFGFSRGAFTARSLAGLITACGILKRSSLGSLPDAWRYYRSDKPHTPEAFARQYQTDCHTDVSITFLGVWDTVGSLGIPGHLMADRNHREFAFHDTTPSPILKKGAHALAIDEHRHTFVPTFWTEPKPPGADIEQVWFAGAHADVGGGYITRTLADIPLVWMARKAEASGLALDWTCLPNPTTLKPTAPAHDSASGIFALDRYRPTLRQIGTRSCQAGLTESLYSAMDPEGKPLVPINQAVHRSVIERHDQKAELCADDEKGACSLIDYTPATLRPYFGTKGFSGLPVVD